jgi:hypothetical protein
MICETGDIEIPGRSFMRKVLLAIVAAGLISVARPSLTQLTHQEMKAEDFIEYITVANPYTTWQTWPDKAKRYKGVSPHGHGMFLTTYVNRAALQSIAASKGMADGSIVVTENYDAGKTLAGLTTMYKVGGYNPEAGNWYWVEATPTGKVLRFGKVQPCIDCHGIQAANDYIWTGQVVKEKYNKTATP